jgi:formylmethanofuran dehydrogenase subunit E
VNTHGPMPELITIICAFLLLIALAVQVGAVETDSPEWYFPQWMTEAPHSPVFKVRDTVNKYGRYAKEPKIISLKDLIKYHGHFCGGLVEGSVALRVAFDRLFPDEMIDRTDLIVASNNSACGGDVVSYLSGTRTRFGSHLIDLKLKESDFVVKRLSTGKTVRVVINKETYPHDVRIQMKKIESGDFKPVDIDLFQDLQWAYAKKLVTRPLVESIEVMENPTYVWPEHLGKDLGKRKDNDYKNTPEAD